MLPSPYESDEDLVTPEFIIHDADTLIDRRTGRKIRIQGINANEMYNPGEDTPRQVLAREATAEAADFLSQPPSDVTEYGEDRFGRTLGSVEGPDGDLATHLVENLYARPYYKYNNETPDSVREQMDAAARVAAYNYNKNPDHPVAQAIRDLPYKSDQVFEAPPPPPVYSRKPGVLGTLGAAISRGVDQFQGTLGEAEAAVGRWVGSPSMQQAGREYADENAREAAQNPAQVPSYEDILQYDENGNIQPWESAKRAGTWALEKVGENAVQIPTAIAGGIAGAAIAPELMAGTVLGRAAMSLAPAALRASPQAARLAAGAAGAATGKAVVGFAGHVGELEQDQAESETKAPAWQHLTAAAARTGLDFVSDLSIFTGVLAPTAITGLASLGAAAAKVALKGAVMEAPTEAAQELISIGMRMSNDQNYDPINNSDQRREALHRLTESFLAGGVVGGVMGGVGAGAKGAVDMMTGPSVAPTIAPPDPIDTESSTTEPAQPPIPPEAMDWARSKSPEEIQAVMDNMTEVMNDPKTAPEQRRAAAARVDVLGRILETQAVIEPQSPRVQVGKDPNSISNKNAQIYRDYTDKTGLTEKIEDLFAMGLSALKVTHHLKEELTNLGMPEVDQMPMIINVRETLGIPARSDSETKFNKWLAKYQKRKSSQPQPPSSEALSPSPTTEAVSDEVKANTLAAVKRIDQHYSDYTPGLQDSEYEQDDEDNQPQEGEDLSPAEEQGLQSKENALVRGRMIYGGNGEPLYMDSSKDSVPDNKIVAQVGGYQTPVGSGLSRLQKVAGENTKLVGIDDKGNVVDVTQYAGKQDNVDAAKEAMTGIQRIIAIPADAPDLHEAVIKASQQPEVHSLRPMADKWVVESSHASERGANGYTQMEEAMALRTASKLGQDKLMAKTAMNKVNPDGSLELNKKGEPVTYMMDAMTLTKIGRRQDSVTTMEDATDADKRKWFLDGLATARLHGYTPVGMPKGNDASINDAEELQQSLDSLNSAGVDKQNFRGKGGVQISAGKDFNETRVKPFESDLSEADIQGIANGSIKQEDVAASIIDLNHLKGVVDSLPEDAPVTKAKLRNLLAQAKGKAAGAKLDPTRSPAVDAVLDSLTVYPNNKGKVKQSTRGYLGKLIGDELYRQNRLQRELENPNDTVTEEARKDQDMYGEFPEQEASEGIRSLPAKPGDVDSANAFIKAYNDWQDAGAKPEARSEALSKVYRPDYAMNPSLSFDDHFTTGADPNETLNGMVDKARTIANSAGRVVGEDRNTAVAQTEVKGKIEALRAELKALEAEEGITGNVQLESGTKIHIPNVETQITSLQDKLQTQRKKGSKAQLEALRAQIKEADAVIDNKGSTRAEKAAAESTLADLMTRFDRLNAPRSPATHSAIETQLKTLQSQVKAAKVSDAAGDIRNQISALEAQLPKQNPDEYAKGDASSIPDDREDAYEKDNIAQRQKPVTPVRKTATIHERVENHHSDKRVHGFLSDISKLLGIKTRFAVIDEDGVKSYGDSLRQSVADQKERVGKAMKIATSADLYDDNEQLRADMRDELQHLMRNVPVDEVKRIELMEAMIARLKDGEQLGTVPQPKQFENLSRKDWENVKPVFSMIARVHTGDDTVIKDWVDYLGKADRSLDLQDDTADFVAKRLEQAQSSRSKKGWIHYMDDMEYAEDRVPVIFVSKELKGVEKIRVAAHEMGHLIMRTSLQDLINRRESDPDAREVIDKIFGKGVDWKDDKSIQDASENFAEMTMQWVNSNKTPKTLVEKWFSKLVDELKELWTSLTTELKLSNRAEQVENFNAFMNGLMYKANSMGMVYENGKLVDKTNKMMRDGKEVYIPADFRRFKEAVEGLSLSETLPKRPAETMSDYFGQDIVDAVKNAGPVKSSVTGAASLFNAIRPQLASIGAELRRMDSTTAKQFARYIRVMPGEQLRKPYGKLSTTIPERMEVMNARWIPKAVDALKDIPAMPLASMKRFNKDYDATVAKIQAIQDDLLMERATVSTPEAKEIRKFLNDIHDVLGKELNIGFKPNYFPHIFNPDKMLADGASVHIKNVLMKHEGMNPQEAINVYNRLVRTAGVPVDELIDLDSVIRSNAVNAKKARKFSDETRRELAKYYEDDIHRVTLNYVNSLVKRIAWQSVYGSENMDVLWNDVTKSIQTVPQGGWDPLGKLRVALLKAEIGYDKNLPSSEMLSPEQLKYFREKAIPAALGYLGSDMNPTVRKTVEYVKTFLNVGLLPGAMLASLTDLAGIPVRMGDHTDTRKMLRGMTTMMKAATSKEAREYAEVIGVIHDAVTDHVLNSSTDSDTTRGLSGKINDKFFRVIGLKAWTDMTRVMAVAVAKLDIKDNYEKALNGDAKAVDRLARLGLTPQSVADWLQSGNEDRISDLETMPDNMIAALHRWTNQAIMKPDAMTMPPMGSDQRMRFFWYLHGFQWSYYNTTMKQVMQNVRDADGVAKALPVVFLAAASLPLVALGYELRKFVFNTVPSETLGIPNRTQKKEGSDYFWELVKRWGVMGPMSIAADYRETDKRGDIAALNLLGVPTEKTIELLNDGLGSFLLHTTPLIAQSRPLRDALTPYLNPVPPRSEKRRETRN